MEKKLRGGTGANQHFSEQNHHLDEPALPTHKRLAKEYGVGSATIGNKNAEKQSGKDCHIESAFKTAKKRSVQIEQSVLKPTSAAIAEEMKVLRKTNQPYIL